MPRRHDTTSAIIDAVLKTLLAGGAIGSVIIAPNALIGLEKPLGFAFDKLNKRAQERELRRILSYMKKKELIREHYQHGLSITRKGRKRLQKLDLEQLEIPTPEKWDKKWRLVFYDIPEKHKSGRDALTHKLKELGFYPLQRSALVHPFPCRDEITMITAAYDINSYVSYIETDHIDQQKQLIKRFPALR